VSRKRTPSEAALMENDAQTKAQPEITPVLLASTRTPSEPLEIQIRELAYRLYEQRGRIEGHEIEDWAEAEAIIRAKGKLAA
jgi:Protein of unknown function (DUF2934)